MNVDIGTAGSFVILAKAGITNVRDSVITGDVGVSPIAASSMTAFDLILDSSTTFSTSNQVIGIVKAADYANPTSFELTTAVSDMEAAYTSAAGRVTTPGLYDTNSGASYNNVGGGKIGGKTLTTGVYTFTKDVDISGGNLTFSGTATDVFIIQTTGSIIQEASTKVVLSGGALAKNIFWQVAGVVEVSADSHMKGIILAATSVTFITGSSLEGRIFSQTYVALQMATITQPTMQSSAPSSEPSSIPSGGPTDN
jgi:hypothetical protein